MQMQKDEEKNIPLECTMGLGSGKKRNCLRAQTSSGFREFAARAWSGRCRAHIPEIPALRPLSS